MFKTLLLSSIVLMSGLANALEPVSSTAPVLDTSDLMTVLDSRAPQAEREAAMAKLRESAEAGNSFAMYDLGSLARQTRFKEDPVIRHDPGAALMWLTRAFDHGRLSAAFKLALVHRELGDQLEAMAWLQVHNYYLKGSHLPPDQQRPMPKYGPEARLMATLQEALDHESAETIRQRTIALLQKHGTQFESAKPTPTEDVDGCRVRPPPKGFRATNSRRVEPSVVEIVAIVEPDGSARDIVIMDSSPDFMSANMVRQFGFSIACPKIEEGAGDRRVFVPFRYGGFPKFQTRSRAPR